MKTKMDRYFYPAILLLCAAGLVRNAAADGLPGEYLISDEWRRLFSFQSPASNPAFMTEQDYISVRGAFALSLDGPSRLFETGAVKPIGLYQAAGFTAIVESGKDIEDGYIASGRYIPSDQTMNNGNFMLMGSYAINPWRNLSIGANVNYARQENFGDPSSYFCVDAGASWRILRHPAIGDHTAGITYQNFLSSLYTINNAPVYPEQIRTILHSTYLESRLKNTIEVDITDITNPPLEWGMTLQAGAWLLRIFKVHAFMGLHGNKKGGEMDAWGLAGGINAPMLNNGRDVNVEYQFRDEINNALMSTHSLNIRFEIGKHREEIYAGKIAIGMNILPNDLYNRALRLYFDKRYWDAYFVFGQILAMFPDFFKNDMVTYYRASCCEEMDMRQLAITGYEEVKKAYPKSSAIASADLGLMRIVYREEDHVKIQEQYALLDNENVMDSLKYHACYLMGESLLKQKESKKSIQYLALIPESHPEFIFARHTMGVAHIMDADMTAAAEAFESGMQAQIKTPAQQEVYNRTCLLLGYLFYEEQSLSKAVTAFRMVAPGSYYYEDVILGFGWTAIQARQWTDCISAGSALSQISDKITLQCEGALIKSYGLIMQKNYAAAQNELLVAFEKLSKTGKPEQELLEIQQNSNALNRSIYNAVALEIQNVSLSEFFSNNAHESDSLHIIQKVLFDSLKAFDKFSDEYSRLTFFYRGIDKIREDIEYAIAVIDNLKKQSGTVKVQEKLKEETKDIDKEIELLEQEMNKIQEKE